MKNIQESLGELTKFLNFESKTVPTLVGSQNVNLCFLKKNNVFIELIDPTVEYSPISAFTANGGGFHHLCFEVDDIQKEIENMVKNGGHIIVKPVKGFDDRLIAFLVLNMKNTNCNLIELVEIKK